MIKSYTNIATGSTINHPINLTHNTLIFMVYSQSIHKKCCKYNE